MLKLVRCKSLPIAFPVDEDSEFQPGQIAQLKVSKDNTIVCGTSDGTAPFGIIDDIRVKSDDTTRHSNRITVWFQRDAFETDQFDKNEKYVFGQPLYVNADGVLTSKQPNASHPEVAMCCNDDTGATLRFIWTGVDMLDSFLKDPNAKEFIKEQIGLV